MYALLHGAALTLETGKIEESVLTVFIKAKAGLFYS
jgi:hypothetical protein